MPHISRYLIYVKRTQNPKEIQQYKEIYQLIKVKFLKLFKHPSNYVIYIRLGQGSAASSHTKIDMHLNVANIWSRFKGRESQWAAIVFFIKAYLKYSRKRMPQVSCSLRIITKHAMENIYIKHIFHTFSLLK